MKVTIIAHEKLYIQYKIDLHAHSTNDGSAKPYTTALVHLLYVLGALHPTCSIMGVIYSPP